MMSDRRIVPVAVLAVLLQAGCVSVPELEDRLSGIEFAPNQYIVRASDTVPSVAFRYRMTPDDLRRLNPGLPDPLVPGMALNVAPPLGDTRLASTPATRPAEAPVVAAPAPAPTAVVVQGAPLPDERIVERPIDTWREAPRNDDALARYREAVRRLPPADESAVAGQAVIGGDDPYAAARDAGDSPVVMTERRASVRLDPPREIAGRDAGLVDRLPPPEVAVRDETRSWPREEIVPDPLEATLGPQTDRALLGEERIEPLAMRDDNPAPSHPASSAISDTPAFGGRWNWPTDGAIARGFRPDQVGGQGIDIAGVPGQDVRAAMDGTVVYSGRDLSGVGNLVILRHPDDLLSTYSHADELYVAEDDIVRAGDPIASLGANEHNESVLGFEIRRDGNPLNPLEFLPVK